MAGRTSTPWALFYLGGYFFHRSEEGIYGSRRGRDMDEASALETGGAEVICRAIVPLQAVLRYKSIVLHIKPCTRSYSASNKVVPHR